MDIKAERLKRGWTQQDLARRIGYTAGIISNWENGRVKMTSEAMKLLEDLFSGKKIKPKPRETHEVQREYVPPPMTRPKDLEPVIKFKKGQTYKFQTGGTELAQERYTYILTFQEVQKGDRWIKHYIFRRESNTKTSFTQLQLRDYKITEL